jgi:adenylate cyclase
MSTITSFADSGDLLPSSGPVQPMRPRRSLFIKYFVTLFIAVVGPLIVGAISNAWFGYRDQRVAVDELLLAEARSATDRIQTFIDEIRNQLGWAVQLAWTDGDDEQHRVDGLRLLRQVPAIASVKLVDGTGVERAFISRMGVDRIGRGADLSGDPAVIGARAGKVWYGPVRFRRGSEPYMVMAISGNRPTAGVAIADINLKLIWDVIAAIKIGETGYAFVVDGSGRLIAHPDLSRVLRGNAGPGEADRLHLMTTAANEATVVTTNDAGKPVVAVSVRAAGLGWTVIAQQPVTEAFASIRAAMWRSVALIMIGTLFALALAYWLAQRMSGPIAQLEDGVRRIGAGQFDHRITISSGDELEQLAGCFNEMAGELAVSRDKSERIVRLKRFLAPQVAELVERSGNERLLDGRRRDVVAIFGDLRGFTSFSSHAEPDVIMDVLRDYYEAVGVAITRHGATLIGFDGDGVMALVNAPVTCEDPALRGIRLAMDMQAAVQSHVVDWYAKGHAIGFGVGIAMGPAIVGTVGYEGRMDYTAIGSSINLASRLCALADDTQILVDPAVAECVKDSVVLASLGVRTIKGYDDPLQIYVVARSEVGTVL